MLPHSLGWVALTAPSWSQVSSQMGGLAPPHPPYQGMVWPWQVGRAMSSALWRDGLVLPPPWLWAVLPCWCCPHPAPAAGWGAECQHDRAIWRRRGCLRCAQATRTLRGHGCCECDHLSLCPTSSGSECGGGGIGVRPCLHQREEMRSAGLRENSLRPLPDTGGILRGSASAPKAQFK